MTGVYVGLILSAVLIGAIILSVVITMCILERQKIKDILNFMDKKSKVNNKEDLLKDSLDILKQNQNKGELENGK